MGCADRGLIHATKNIFLYSENPKTFCGPPASCSKVLGVLRPGLEITKILRLVNEVKIVWNNMSALQGDFMERTTAILLL